MNKSPGMKTFISSMLFALLVLGNNSQAALKQAPEIDLPSTQGTIQLQQLRGKVVYLDFWASWCTPCKKSFPWMNRIKQDYEDRGFEILAVNLDKDRQLADEFLAAMDVNFRVAFDQSGKTAARYKLTGMPSSYLIGRDGKVYASHVGFREKDKVPLQEAIESLLDKQ